MSLFQEPKEVELSDEEKVTIYCLAEGEISMRPAAEKIFMEHIAAHVNGGRVSNFINFLSEVFNKCPDAVLKKIYRERILMNIPPGVAYDKEDQRFYFNAQAMSENFTKRWFRRRNEFPQQKHM